MLRGLAIASWLALIVTVGRAGILYAAAFTMAQGEIPRAWSWQNLRLSFWYTLPTMGILAAHEGGHWWAARARGLRTVGPFAVPLPTQWLAALHVPGVPRIGMLGAFLVLRYNDPNFLSGSRNAGAIPAVLSKGHQRVAFGVSRADRRFEIAFAGLFCGFCAAVACSLVGLAFLSPAYTGHAVPGRFWTPTALSWLTAGRSWHPLVTASWVGWLLTKASTVFDGFWMVLAPWSVWRAHPWQAGGLIMLVIACWA